MRQNLAWKLIAEAKASAHLEGFNLFRQFFTYSGLFLCVGSSKVFVFRFNLAGFGHTAANRTKPSKTTKRKPAENHPPHFNTATRRKHRSAKQNTGSERFSLPRDHEARCGCPSSRQEQWARSLRVCSIIKYATCQ